MKPGRNTQLGNGNLKMTKTSNKDVLTEIYDVIFESCFFFKDSEFFGSQI